MFKQFRQLFIGMIVLSLACLASAQTEVIDSFVNLDFDESTEAYFPNGFDFADTYDIPGWMDYGTITDAGIESDGCWWGNYDTYSAFLAVDNGAYNMSSYAIQEGDAFIVSFWAKCWDNVTTCDLTATLFYGSDPDANPIGSFTATALTYSQTAGEYVYYESTPIKSSVDAVGQVLGISILNSGTGGFANFDEMVVERVLMYAHSPADESEYITTLRTNADNDLVFDIYDSTVGANDIEVYFDAGDPNADDLLTTIAAPGTGTHTVTLENELAADLAFETTYYWKVVGYKTVGGDPVSTPVMSFTTVPEVPDLGAADPELVVVAEGSDAEITLEYSYNVDENDYQWYKVVNDAEDVELTNGEDYDGVTTNTLTIKSVTAADEGAYYCKGTNAVGADNNKDEACRVMIERLVNHYSMESITDGTTPDVIGGADMDLVSIGDVTAVLSTDVADPALGTCLGLVNPAENDPNGVYGQLPAGTLDYNDITISSWVKWDGSTNWQRVWDFGNDDTQYMFLTPHNGTIIRFAINDGVGENTVDSQDTIVVGEWTYIAVTLSGDTAKLYVNGELQGTNESATIDPIDFKPALNYIGESQFAADQLFDGSIDDLKIYNYALTTEEIAQEYMDIMGGWVCNNELESSPFDFNNDCLVDIVDFASFAGGWLESKRIYDDLE